MLKCSFWIRNINVSFPVRNLFSSLLIIFLSKKRWHISKKKKNLKKSWDFIHKIAQYFNINICTVLYWKVSKCFFFSQKVTEEKLWDSVLKKGCRVKYDIPYINIGCNILSIFSKLTLHRSVSDLLSNSKFNVNFAPGRGHRNLLHIAAK